MGKQVMLFLISFVVAFGGGYLFWAAAPQPGKSRQETQSAAAKNSPSPAVSAATTVSSQAGDIFEKKGCIACHAVSSLKVKGGSAGPDLSQAYVNVESKHGVKLEDFLRKPTSAVMSGVIGGNPLTDEEVKALTVALKAAAETK